MTDEEREKWLEGAEAYGDPIENKTLVPVMAEDEIDTTVSFPAVKYDRDPEQAAAKPVGFRQVLWKTFWNKITTLAGQVADAVSDLVDLKASTEAARDAANTAAGSVQTAIDNAEAATAYAERVNATMNGMEITVTDRNGVSVTKNIGFDMVGTYASVALMNADAANVEEGKFVIIATDDPVAADNAKLFVRNGNDATSQNPFSFCADLDQASAAAWADWLESMKPQIQAAITQAGTDHTIATQDHTTALSDHTTATGDHSVALNDHTTADADHTTAGQDHQTATADHSQATTDHQQATQDHQAAVTATDGAENVNAELSGTIITVTNRDGEQSSADLKGQKGDKGDDLDWESMTEEEKRQMVEEIKASLVFATVETCEDIISELI